MSKISRPPKTAAGFTLVEVLIAVAMLTVTVGLLFGALYTMGRSARAGEERLQEVDSHRLIQSFLRRQLGAAVPLTERRARRGRVLLAGSTDTLRFVGHLPAHRGGGGLQFLHLSLELADGSGTLVLHHRNAWPEVSFDSSLHDGWSRVALTPGVQRIELSYFGEQDEKSAAAWTRAWSDLDRLPAMIQIDLELADGRRWPSLAIAVRTRTAEGQPRLLRATGEDRL